MIPNKDLCIDSENGKIVLNGDKYDLGTQGEIDTAVKDVYSVMGQNGAKNLIPYPYTNAYRTTNGVTITEGSITGSCIFNGTSTGRVDAQLGYHSSNALTLLPSVQYSLSIKTDGSFVGNLAVEAWNKGTTTYAKGIARVTPSSTGSDYKEVKFSVTQSDINNYDIAVLIYGNSGNTFNNVTVYPMLRLASDTDNTYEPYAMTNKQLTEQVADVKGTIGDITQTGFTGSTVAAQLGVLGAILNFTHFVQIPFSTSVLDSIEAAFENGTIPVDVYGITFGIVRGDAGSQRAVFIAQNQSLGATQTRCGAIYFGSYTAPHYCYKQDSAAWVDTAL